MSCLHHQIIFFRNVPTGPDYMLPLPADQTHSPKHTASHSRKSEALATPLLLAPILQIFRQISERESDTADCHTAVRMKTNFAAHVKTLKCCNDKSIALVGCGGGEGTDASATRLGQTQYQCCYWSVRSTYRIWSCLTPSLELGFGTVRLLVVCIPQEHLNRICWTCDDVKNAKGKWFWENRAEFYTAVSKNSFGAGGLTSKSELQQETTNVELNFVLRCIFDSSSVCKETNMEALLPKRSKCYEWSTRWSTGLTHRSAPARLLGSRIRIPLRTWMFASCICCVLCRYLPLRRGWSLFQMSATGFVYVYQRVNCKPQTWDGLGYIWGARPQKNNYYM